MLSTGALACGTDDGVQESRVIGDTLTVFSSLPQQGPLGAVSRDVVRAEKLALQEAGGRAGAFNVSYVSLDSADPQTGRSEPGRVAANARRAVQTPNTVAYLGELEPGASAVSVPILNAGGILQVSPRDTFGGLTERGARGEPERFYPSGVVNFARVVPPGGAQGRGIVAAMRAAGVRRLAVADDAGVQGGALAGRVAGLARAAGIDVVGRRRLDPRGEVPEDLAGDLREARADAFFYGGASGDFAVEVLQTAAGAGARLRLYGADALTVAPGLPGLSGAAADRLTLTGVDPGEQAAFARRFRAAYGAAPDRQAVLGYRSMRLVLEAVRAAGKDADSRREVIRRAMALAEEPVATFKRYRLDGHRLVSVGSPL
jgi:branched-chain amino acid transport system substrate-binding protein